jgi:hypothetical protein
MDANSRLYAQNTKLITITNRKLNKSNKHFNILQIYQIDFLYNQLLPLFDSLEFHTKKFKDYQDFKLLVKLIYQGKHLIPEGKKLIYSIANRMNNNRLTTNINSLNNFVDETHIKNIFNLKPLFEKDLEGRVINVLTNKYIRSVYIIEVTLPNGETIKFHNATNLANFFNINDSLVSGRIKDGKLFKTNKGLIKIRRIPIFNKLN